MLSKLMPESVFQSICIFDLYLDDKIWKLNVGQFKFCVYVCKFNLLPRQNRTYA